MLPSSIRRHLLRLTSAAPLLSPPPPVLCSRLCSAATPLSSASPPSSSSNLSVAGDGNQGKEVKTGKSSVALIVNALRLGERQRASTLLSSLVSEKDCLRAENIGYIFDFCARAPNPLFAMETWKLFIENKVEMDSKCWIHITQALCKGGYFSEAFSLLCSLGESDHATIPVYNSFLNGCSRSGNWDHANKCLQLMEANLIGKSEITYRELLKLAVYQKCPSLAHEIYTEFKIYYEPSILSLQMFILAFSKLGDLASACSILRDMISLSLERSTSRYPGGGSRTFQRLDIPIPHKNNMYDIGNDHTYLAVTAKKPTEISKKEVENGLDLASVESAFLCKKEDNIQHTDLYLTRSSKGNAFRYRNGLESGKDALLFPYLAYADGIGARRMLVRSFNSLIHACAKFRYGELAEQLFLQMLHLGLAPSAGTYDGVVRAVIFTKGASYAVELVEEMRMKNLKPYSSTTEALSIGYSRLLELNYAEDFLDQSLKHLSRSIHPFNALLTAYNKVDKPEKGIQLLAKMKHFNIKPNAKTYELLFSLFGNVNAPYEEGNYSSQADVTRRVHAIEMDMIRNGVKHTLFTLENLIGAFGSEGMMEDVLRYLSMAENMFSDAYPGTITYNIVLHALVEAKNHGVAIQIFNKMRLLRIPLDAATYNIMIDLCSNLNFLRTAYSLMSLMIRDGFLPSACTNSTLMKIFLANENFDEALKLLDQSLSLGLDVDVLLFDTILEEACMKGHLNIVQLITEKMHEEKIRPDPSTCSHVFSAYLDAGFHITAMEALQVLSMRMISEEASDLQDSKAMYESLLYSEDPAVESWIVDVFCKSNEYIGAALLNLRWCAISGFDISWSPNESLWAQRLSARYGSHKHPA